MRKKYIWFLVLGIFILIVPTIIYLCFLVPQLKEEYNILMASGGAIGGAGLYGASKIPDSVKYSSLFKLSANAFTLMTVGILIQEFYIEIIGLICTFIISYIIFKILLEVYKSGKRRNENAEFAKEISRNIVENSK